MTIFLEAGDELEMFFNGPMRSGIVLDSQALLNTGYRDFQQKLSATLDDLYLGRWECPVSHARRSHLAFDVDNFQGETIIPRYLIARSFEGDDLEEILAEFHLHAEFVPHMEKKNAAPAGSFRLEKLAIFLYDYGYASCQIRGYIVAAKDMTLQEYRSLSENISSSLPDFTELFHSTVTKVAKTLPPEFVLLNYHTPESIDDDAWKGTTLRHRIGELFWVHRVFSIACKTQEEFDTKKIECRALAYGGRHDGIKDSSTRPDIAFYPGFGNSCVVYLQSTTHEGDVAKLRSVVRAKNVFYAALQDMDRDLFYLGNDLALKRAHTAESLEREMAHMDDALARTGFLKSVYDDYDNQLDPQSILLWDQLRITWIMGDVFRALDQKAARMEKTCDRTAHRLAALQSRRMTHLVAILTVVAVLTLGATLAGGLPAFHHGVAGAAEAILLAFALGAATLLTVRYFSTK